MSSNEQMIRNIVEAALLAAGEPVSIERLEGLFEEEGAHERLPEVGRSELRTALDALADDYAERGLELKEVASGWRVQVRGDLAPWVSRLWESRPPKYSRALLETLVLIAYQQPVTRSDIEQVRGVSVSSNIIRTLLDRDWIRIVGHRDVPGRPALYGTTRAFLDYFNLRSLDQLPPLAEIRDLARINEELGFDDEGSAGDKAGGEDAGEGDASPGGADRPAPDPEGGHEVVPVSAVLGQFETPDDSGAESENPSNASVGAAHGPHAAANSPDSDISSDSENPSDSDVEPASESHSEEQQDLRENDSSGETFAPHADQQAAPTTFDQPSAESEPDSFAAEAAPTAVDQPSGESEPDEGDDPDSNPDDDENRS